MSKPAVDSVLRTNGLGYAEDCPKDPLLEKLDKFSVLFYLTSVIAS